MQGLQRFPGDRPPQRLAELFRVRTGVGRRDGNVWCDLWSHPRGWEVRLFAAGHLVQSRVCPTQEEVLTTMEVWKGEQTARRR